MERENSSIPGHERGRGSFHPGGSSGQPAAQQMADGVDRQYQEQHCDQNGGGLRLTITGSNVCKQLTVRPV